ncbi:myosin-11-like isoform X2 [Halichondria panicea]|uniref:myosin-11-like isoform X2 n=1 Tax=Halichondria panicea TaxID=6063 RepID=UPI00312B4547
MNNLETDIHQGGNIQQSDGVQWMESKANMLDEMSQLVDLMTSEKIELTNKITVLKAELESAKDELTKLGECRMQADKDKKSYRTQLKELKRNEKHGILTLNVVLEATRKELEATKLKLSRLSSDLEKSQTETKHLTERNSALEARLAAVQSKKTEQLASLSKKTEEKAKLSSQLTNWRERCYTLRADNTQLMSSLTSAQKNFHHSQDEVLALRGRLTSTRKACEQLQMKCTSLEHTVETLARRSPTVVRVPSRSREEVRLTEECKRKDVLFTSCMKDMSASNSKNHLLQKDVNVLQSQLETEKRERMLLLSTLKTREREWEDTCKDFKLRMTSLTATIEAKEKQKLTLTDLRKDVGSRMSMIETELKTARDELCLVRREVAGKEELWDKEKRQLKEKREQMQIELKACQEKVMSLTSELECAQDDHQTSAESQSRECDRQINEIKEDYRRMKEASTNRCTELAKEVWRLKTELEQWETTDSFHRCTNLPTFLA